MLYFLSFLLVFTTHAENSRLPLPKEIISVLQEEYPLEKSIRPVLEDLTVTIKGEKNSQTAKVGITHDTLDLAAYVDKKVPTFEIFFKPAFEITQETKLFFINRYRPSANKEGGGMACGKALKIQAHLDKLFSTQGVKLMTKDGAYLNLVGGDFLLTHLEGQQLHVVYFKIVDGKYSSRLCR